MTRRIVCVGGGAASFFAAIHAKRADPLCEVEILEGTGRVLTKVRVSGGGRCNVTHALFDLRAFASRYPRGSKELLGPLHRFGPEDTIKWFEDLGVELKVESDGRMFPTTDRSETILSCLREHASSLGVLVRTGSMVKDISTRNDGGFTLHLRDETLSCDALFLGTGGMVTGHQFARGLGHTITELAPSLFTFCVRDPLIEDLAGISFPSVDLKLSIEGSRPFAQSGPLLITHWGLSGPAILKLSAFAARQLKACSYRARLKVDFLPNSSRDELSKVIERVRHRSPKKLLVNVNPFDIPARFWKQMASQLGQDLTWAHMSRKQVELVVETLKACSLLVDGKGEFKEEFVTCGGVKLSEINFKTMESRICPGLFLGGEILDIDGITGGFNFQNAWTSGYIAGQSMAESYSRT